MTDDHSDSEEIRQSSVRLVFIAIVYLGIYIFSDFFTKPIADHLSYGQLYLLSLIYLIPVLFHYYMIKRYPDRWVFGRKVFITSIDLISITALLYFLGADGAVYTPLYLWLVMGNGMRHGRNMFLVGILLALLSLSSLLLISPYWRENINVIYGLAIALILLPLFYLRLMNRLSEKNQELKDLLALTEYQAKYDAMTELPNRQTYEKRITQYILKGEPFSLFFIDLDGFKDVNDTHGHHIGDMVLKEVARRIGAFVSNQDMVARFGGDEFVLIKHGAGGKLEDFATSLTDIITHEYSIEGLDLELSASIGVSFYPDDTTDEIQLNCYADKAMYEAKKRGGNRYVFFQNIQKEEDVLSGHPAIVPL